MRRQRRRLNKGILALGIIGTIFTSTILGGAVTEKVSTRNSHVETIEVSYGNSITLDIKDDKVKAKIEEVLNDAIIDIRTENINNIQDILFGDSSDLDNKLDKDIPIGSLSISNMFEHEINNIENNRIEQELIVKREEIAKEQERIRLEEEERLRKEEEERVRVAKEKEKRRKEKEAKDRQILATRGTSSINASGKNLGTFNVTAYDLSVDSCGKAIGSKGYGITASGFNLAGHTWDSALTIAADTKVIPMGSRVKVTFSNPNYSKYNNIYTVRDRGGAIKGNKIDFFMGDFNQNKAHQDVWNFGRTKANIEILD